MKFTVRGLKRIEELITCEVISYVRLNNALNGRRHNGKTGKWLVG